MKNYVFAALLLGLSFGISQATPAPSFATTAQVAQNPEISQETLNKLVAATASLLECSEQDVWDAYYGGEIYYEQIDTGVYRVYQGGNALEDFLEDTL